jgi:GT2 family glycosyltransferase
VSWVKDEFPHVHLIQNSINRGYSFACNQGILVAQGEWIFFLNPDVHISIESLKKMIAYAHEHNLDAVSPTPHSNNYKKPLPTPLSFLKEFTPLTHLIPHWLLADLVEQFTLFGGCLGVRRWIIEDLGGWDERFFVWFEDGDLTKRLYKAGYKIGWAPIDFKHIGGSSFEGISTQTKRDIFFNEMLVYADKHFGFLGRATVKLIRLKFTKTKLLPETQHGVSITVPNMKQELLDVFLEKNKNFFHSIKHLIIVTSCIKPKDIWSYRKKFPDIRFIPIDQNKGFTHTVNIGFRASTTTWIGTVNDDVELNSDWLNTCLNHVPENAGSINPIIIDMNGDIESAGIRIQSKGRAVPIRKVQPLDFDHVDATNAAAVLYKNSALQQTGLFDEKFGSYLEDIDLSMRMTKHKFVNYICSLSKVRHHGQSTSKSLGKKKHWLDFKNWILIIIKNWPLSWKIRYAPQIFIERLRNISGIIKS